MKKRLATLLLALALLCGCTAQAQTVTGYIHGRTEPPTAGVVVCVSYGSTRTSTTNAGGAWGVGVDLIVGRVYTITATAPEGWTVSSITHPTLGTAKGNVLQVTIPSATNLGPDFVVYLKSVEAPVPTATRTATPWPTMPPQSTAVPPATAPIPTPPTAWPTPTATRTPKPTPPPGGFEVWADPPAELANALAWEIDWMLDEYARTADPLWLAATSRGPVWPMGLPVVTHYDGATPDGGNVEMVLRWQVFLTPRGWRLVFARPEEPYRVAVIEGEGW